MIFCKVSFYLGLQYLHGNVFINESNSFSTIYLFARSIRFCNY